MTTASLTLLQFLLAQIDADEATARAAYYEGQVWLPEEEAVIDAGQDWAPVMFLDRKCDARHAANWPPARVLAECEARRRLAQAAGPFVLRLLALPYADDPNYRQEWRP